MKLTQQQKLMIIDELYTDEALRQWYLERIDKVWVIEKTYKDMDFPYSLIIGDEADAFTEKFMEVNIL